MVGLLGDRDRDRDRDGDSDGADKDEEYTSPEGCTRGVTLGPMPLYNTLWL